MRAVSECYDCLAKLGKKTAELTTADSSLKKNALDKALAYLDDNFSTEQIPTWLATVMQRIIRQKTNCSDPFLHVKTVEMEKARYLSALNPPPADALLSEFLDYAVRGNSIDFFVDIKDLEAETERPVKFAVDDTFGLYKALNNMGKDSKILYLADNAGECYFDIPLVKKLGKYGTVYYGVKGLPVQNDLTIKEVTDNNLQDALGNVITTGNDSPGLSISTASRDFLRMFNGAGLIIAKGMGHYETLTEIDLPAPTVLLFKAKCKPIANSAGVPLNSYLLLQIKK